MSSLDPRDPLVVDVRDLRGAGTMVALRRTAPAPADLAAGLVGVPAGSPIDLDLRLESVIEGVLVSGTVSATVVGECARCLGPVSWEESVALTELYLRTPGPDDELPAIDADDLISLEPAVRDAVVLSLPLSPVCRPDCPGLCVECGELADGHTHDRVDPRWARLAGFGSE
jgi:uncharacterized protein